MHWLLDTNVVSEPRRPRPNHSVTRFLTNTPSQELFLSSVVLAEIRVGIESSVDPRRSSLQSWLDDEVRPYFAGRILEVSQDVIVRALMLAHEGRKSGRTFSQPDLFLAATAIEHHLTLVTRNLRDFTGINLSILNPWETS